jgi:hypothetical protein
MTNLEHKGYKCCKFCFLKTELEVQLEESSVVPPFRLDFETFVKCVHVILKLKNLYSNFMRRGQTYTTFLQIMGLVLIKVGIKYTKQFYCKKVISAETFL